MFRFTYILNKNRTKYIRALNREQPNPQYCLCERFFTSKFPNYKNLVNVQPFDEIVTVDMGLNQVLKRLNNADLKICEISKEQQILCVYCMLNEFGIEIEASDIAHKEIPGFEFCGFDLSDGSTSALTNCQGGFEKAFSYKDLNEFGIVSDYYKAKFIQKKLFDEYEEEHTDCVLFAIFRKIIK